MPATAADPAALVESVDLWLWKLAQRYAKRYGLRSDDIAHELRVAAFTSAGNYDPARGRPSTWATWLVRRVMTAHQRAARRAARECQPDPDPDDGYSLATAAVAGEWADPAAEAQRREDAATLARLLGQLAGRQRECVELLYGIGADRPLSVAEVAARLGVSRQLVQTRAAAGLAKLRALAGER